MKLAVATLIFPNQLFKDHPAIQKEFHIFLVEDTRYFTDFAFHKQKLILHRASMKAYQDYLEKKGYKVTYLEFHESDKLFTILTHKKITELHVADLADHTLEHRISNLAKKHKIKLTLYQTPLFLSSREWLTKQLGSKKKYFMHSFYMAQRKELDILMVHGKPAGGSWSYDTENRQRLPDSTEIPKLHTARNSLFVTQAITYVEKHFKDNPGESRPFIYPINFAQAATWLDNFLKDRFAHFGDYEDAIDQNNHFLFHSILSPALNIGLITPAEIIERTLTYVQENKIAINNVEGFIRQVIGWREFMFGVYITAGKQQIKSNFFNHTNKLPKGFYDASTGIPPLDDVINHINKYAYAHHIERLMILGNYLLLRQTKPEEVTRWFMEMFIDAYDWVMVPNVYGMSQYADGGLMTTKPYISSSNYILNMSNYKKGNWCAHWDKLYWDFIGKHYTKLAKIPRMRLIITAYNKKMQK